MVGIYAIDVSKQGKFKQLDVVIFDHKSCVLANKNLNENYMYFVYGQPI